MTLRRPVPPARFGFLLAMMTAVTLSAAAAPGETAGILIAGEGGIFRTDLNLTTGAMSAPERVAAYSSGSWLVWHPSKRVLYSSCDQDGRFGVMSLQVGATGELTPQSVLELPAGHTSHLAIDPAGTLLAASHARAQTVSLITLGPDGRLSQQVLTHQIELPASKSGQPPPLPRPHFSTFTPDGTRLHVVGHGCDRIWTFAIARRPPHLQLLHEAIMPPGFAPRHLDFHPARGYAYVSGVESSTIAALKYDAGTATFSVLQVLDSVGPLDREPHNYTSEIRVHPSGRHVYIGNRGHDSIAVFSIEQKDGRLTAVEREPVRGIWPRNFNFSPDGRWLLAAGQFSNTLASFAVNPETGELTFSRHFISVPAPVRVLSRTLEH